MCGFVGFTGELVNKEGYLKQMMDRIVHRGPDMDGQYTDADIALGFRRLSIIDLSAKSQPMLNEDGSVVLVFNGEIYNFEKLREELIARGHTFETKCDAEVLVHGYEEYGTKLVEHLRGMFAFVIWDKKAKKLFGARDHFGIKPMYYGTLKTGELIFGSEIKSFLDHPDFEKAVNPDALRAYLTFQYSAQEDTFFAGVKKLLPGHCFTYQDGKMEIEPYWDVDFREQAVPFDECVDTLDATVRESVRAHRISDVKVGSFLSGGVDSSYITAALMPDETFSVGFDYHEFNETNYAKELSDRLGIQNFRKLITADECFDAFEDIQYHMDEPQSNPSSVPLYFLAKLARERVTVVLSGEGADEIFAGYAWYEETPPMVKFKKLPKALRGALGRLAQTLPDIKGKNFLVKCGLPEDYFFGQALIFRDKDAVAILKDKYKRGPSAKQVAAKVYAKVSDRDDLTKKQYLDMKLWLPGDILLKADKMCMAHSLELRVPFLDKVVMQMAQTIPSEYRLKQMTTKYILRVAANKTLPDEWATRPKVGFPVPIRYWLREEKYYNLVKERFEADYTAEFFDQKALLKLLDDHFHKRADNQRKIWTVYTFLTWYKRFFVDFH